MSILQRVAPPVQSDRPVLRLVEPVEILDEFEPLAHSLADEAWFAGYTVGQDTDNLCWAEYGDRQLNWHFVMGRGQGRKDRECREAYELGYELGILSEISEPPTGFKPHEASEYRRGFAAGQAELRRAEEDEARDWMERQIEERDRMDAAFGTCEITDYDVYPQGCMS